MKKYQLLLALILILSSCSSISNQTENEIVVMGGKPNWVINPFQHKKVQGKIFGLGSASENIRGEEAQKLKAISIAIDKIARQKGVKVQSALSRVKRVVNSSQSNSMNSYSLQTVNGQKISSKIVDSWKDPVTKKFYVLMVEGN